MLKPLTAKQQYWFDHINAAQRNSQSLSDYAAHHGISLKALYNWRWTLSKRTEAPESKKVSFVKILPSVASTLSNEMPVVAIFPNGIRLQFAALTPALLSMLRQC